ncbi:hypothetical protein AB0H86_37465 [Streptomyces sp. NPDC050997]|uniref:hypothetical protein n=1 Tax=Streptomyces sp. NPDC050997 TaxID=3155519 RepID=UPI00342AD433
MRFRSTAGGALGALTLALGPATLSAPAHAAAPIACDEAVLVSAIEAANDAGGGTIDLAANCVYTLAEITPAEGGKGPNGLPVIREDITINGTNSVIERSTVPGTPEFRIFEVGGTNGELTLNRVTLRNGNLAGGGEGGAIYVHDDRVLTVRSSILANNTAATGGGAIRSNGTATITASTLRDNHARAGGGIYAFGKSTTIVSTIISGNEADFGGGIGNESPSNMTIRASYVQGNTSRFDGGGIGNLGGATLTVQSSHISNNSAGPFGGGIINFGTVTLNSSSVNDNTATIGGGITNSGTINVNDSTLKGNKAGSLGGGLSNFSGTATLTNSSVSGNSAANAGGIYENSGTVTLVRGSVTANTPNNCQSAGAVPGCTN